MGVVFMIAVMLIAFVLFLTPSAAVPLATEGVNEIIIKDQVFSPMIVNIDKGTKVTWTNLDSVPHQIKSDPHPGHTDLSSLSSDPLNYNQTYSYTFAREGVFEYHCEVHPEMNGTIVVK